MKHLLAPIVALALAHPATAQDFSDGSEAKSWSLYAEVPAKFDATVVDLLCHLTGDCPEDCGAGRRQMGLLRSADNVLILAMKNNQPAFTGAAVDLAPFCNQTVTVDGLLLEDEDLAAKNMYLVQTVTTADGTTQKANTWTQVWAMQNSEAAGEGPWFRRDPRVNAEIAKNGYLGLGLEADAAFIKELFE
ncbi:hypothetical protein [Sulfitobacter guttiformis]|uniref:Uncharacterized protein n=1 Tax=Sulfitobacter guttiformis TaxID=74349 RepID=A0A420DQ49_9RHOB|nr:hypothetical protein [Sulfitobacter guttiformis]KIN73656.1 hypothetical protein Z949_2848 [Sulfitobacter guttiformis KCTC 32187]RKE96300.1 hypothetical protein C8N30_0857 [Sulfitobacter guttiformis]